jgi:hypothetical protein
MCLIYYSQNLKKKFETQLVVFINDKVILNW